ncbi:hypothetical protein [Streptomyces harbinensis]|uniref:hypothetical protein n=1 Tax=Streptomyces harbinensis TaxID=1176198 RepID=UPI0036A8C578
MSARRDLAAALEEIAALRRALAEAGRAIADRDERLNILTRQHADASDRIVRQATELCDLRRQLTATQRQLDDATGMDSPAVEAGARWQERRADRPAVPQPITPANRPPLPRRTGQHTAYRLLAALRADTGQEVTP